MYHAMIPKTAWDGYKAWEKAVSCYTDGSAPPHSPKDYMEYRKLIPDMSKAVVYSFLEQDTHEEVVCYASRRWPCAMGRYILTDTAKFADFFPWMTDKPAYRMLKGGEKPVQMAILTIAKSYVGKVVHLFNMIAPDLQEDFATADNIYFTRNAGHDESYFFYELAKWHARNWLLAFRAAEELGFTKVSKSMPGAGAFWPETWGGEEVFVPKVFNVAMQLVDDDRKELGIEFVDAPWFPSSKQGHHNVVSSLEEDVLYVNAWCHSSFIGNGNARDGTLDGAWGRVAPFAVIGWPPSNPFLGYKDVREPLFPLDPPKRRRVSRG